jgi:predicted dienelactone hydrolase
MANPSPGRCGDIRPGRRVVLKVAALSMLLPLVRIAAAADEAAAITHETVVVPSGALQLKAFLWRPKGTGPFPVVLFNHGSGSVDSAHTGPVAMTEAAESSARFLSGMDTPSSTFSAAVRGYPQIKVL